MKKKVRIGGVPEHFNLAWHLAIENGSFAAKGIDILWHDMPGGTGAMCQALRKGELDIAVALTEGIIADIIEGNPSRLVQFYVHSPLRWGIYVSAHSNIHDLKDIEGKKYAISRYTSGSHLMAYVNAKHLNIGIDPMDFVVVKTLAGAREALAEDTAQVFMWEKFTTKPLVDSGEFRILGECRAFWPSFSVVATNAFIEHQPALLNDVLEIINESCLNLKYHPEAAGMFAWRYQIKLQDAYQWFSELEYACKPAMEEQQMIDILNELKNLHLINRIPLPEDICYYKNLEAV